MSKTGNSRSCRWGVCTAATKAKHQGGIRDESPIAAPPLRRAAVPPDFRERSARNRPCGHHGPNNGNIAAVRRPPRVVLGARLVVFFQFELSL